MNKYLLLRDNKQSGPYTVPEIIAMGIKPYDLVWLEGKSAAWRYPSEIDELKAYAPAVEEQPFDRFYKKPETASLNKNDNRGSSLPGFSAEQEQKKSEHPPLNHQRYQPKIDVPNDENTSGKKVYINFPASGTAASAATSSASVKTSSIAAVSNALPAATEAVDTRREKDIVSERWQHMREPAPVQRKSNRSFYVAVAACTLLGIVSGILFFNYYQQREALNQLTSMVQKMESEKKNQQASQAVLVQDTPLPQQSSTLIEPATAEDVSSIVDAATTSVPEKSAVVKSTGNSAKKKSAPAEQTPAIVFTENTPGNQGTRPVERRKDEQQAGESSNTTAGENLFKLVEVKPNDYKTGLLGGISNLKFEITNKSAVELHRVAVEVKYLGPEKKVVKKHTVYFENVSPGAQSTIDVPKSNRGVSIEYTVVDIKS